MNKDELEQKFTESAKGVWAWQNAHRHVSLVLIGFVVGYCFRWWLAR